MTSIHSGMLISIPLLLLLVSASVQSNRSVREHLHRNPRSEALYAAATDRGLVFERFVLPGVKWWVETEIVVLMQSRTPISSCNIFPFKLLARAGACPIPFLNTAGPLVFCRRPHSSWGTSL